MRSRRLTTPWHTVACGRTKEWPAWIGEPSDARPPIQAAHQRGFIPRCLQSSTDSTPLSSQDPTLRALKDRPVIRAHAQAENRADPDTRGDGKRATSTPLTTRANATVMPVGSRTSHSAQPRCGRGRSAAQYSSSRRELHGQRYITIAGIERFCLRG